jgi:hypothetical protein
MTQTLLMWCRALVLAVIVGGVSVLYASPALACQIDCFPPDPEPYPDYPDDEREQPIPWPPVGPDEPQPEPVDQLP